MRILYLYIKSRLLGKWNTIKQEHLGNERITNAKFEEIFLHIE